MSVTKDGDTGRWMSQIRVTDWTGKTIHKKKRCFATKKEALQWERDFISQSTGSLGMTFGDFIGLYVKDMEHRLKPSTVASKKWLIDLKVTPFFKKIPLNEIKPTHVRQWQNSLTSYRDENGKPYAQTYLKCINNQLTAIFNYAVKYYGLKENPCHKAGSMGKKHADEMLFWTKQEFQTFIEVMKDRSASYTVFMTMYYTGIRERGYYHHSENAEKHPHYPHSRRSLHLFAGVYVPLLRTAKGRPALSLYQELSVSRNGVWLQSIRCEADSGA